MRAGQEECVRWTVWPLIRIHFCSLDCLLTNVIIGDIQSSCSIHPNEVCHTQVSLEVGFGLLLSHAWIAILIDNGRSFGQKSPTTVYFNTSPSFTIGTNWYGCAFSAATRSGMTSSKAKSCLSPYIIDGNDNKQHQYERSRIQFHHHPHPFQTYPSIEFPIFNDSIAVLVKNIQRTHIAGPNIIGGINEEPNLVHVNIVGHQKIFNARPMIVVVGNNMHLFTSVQCHCHFQPNWLVSFLVNWIPSVVVRPNSEKWEE